MFFFSRCSVRLWSSARSSIATARDCVEIGRMSSLQYPFLHNRDTFVTTSILGVTLTISLGAFAWGREGHEIIVIVAEHYTRPKTAALMRELLVQESPEEASVWADEYRHD